MPITAEQLTRISDTDLCTVFNALPTSDDGRTLCVAEWERRFLPAGVKGITGIVGGKK